MLTIYLLYQQINSMIDRLIVRTILHTIYQVPLEDFGPWEKSGYAPEEAFLEKLRAIEGVSQVETQTITNMVI